MQRTIAIGLSPNTEKKDTFFAFKKILSFWEYFQTNHIQSLEQWFIDFFKVYDAISFASGRVALYSILNSLSLKEGDEVALQAFTCVAVVDAVISLKLKPLYIDITKTLTMDPADLEKKISRNTKAVILQYTFGIPADIEKILVVAKSNNIVVIEDVAHTIGAEYKGRKLGSYGDAAIFSFGRDKAFSSVFGGMAITNDKKIASAIREKQKMMKKASYLWTVQQLFHPIAFLLILPFYDVLKLGKVVLFSLQKLNLLSLPVFPEEKKGKISPLLMKKMPNNLASLAVFQLSRIKRYNTTRESLVNLYINSLQKLYKLPFKEKAPLLRFPILTKNRDEILNSLRKKHIYLGTWYSNCIDPKGVDFKNIFFNKKSCPKSLEYAKEIINLPTNPTLHIKDAKYIITLLSQYASRRDHK